MANMQSKCRKNINKTKKKLLLKAIGEIIYSRRISMGKGIILHSYEYDLPSSSLASVEKGTRDPQITTLWKIVNSLDMNFSDFIDELNKKLPENFTLVDD